MAFGSFLAEERAPRPAKEKKPRPVREKTPKQKKTQQADFESVPVVPDIPTVGRAKLQVLLVGRKLSIMQEFLCSMNQNMSEALQSQGFAFYTQELGCISDVVAKKKKLEQFCWSFTDENWTYSDNEEPGRVYTFSISPSGNQDQALDLEFHCITPDFTDRMKWNQTDAVWLLSDGALFRDPDDAFLDYLQDVLDSLPGQEAEVTKPICLIPSQLEHLGHFDGPGAMAVLPAKIMQQILALCRERFSAKASVAVIPVQVYGGMECVGMDGKHDPLLHIGQSGFYQSYIPDNCQIPALYTIQTVCVKAQTDYFADGLGSGLLQGIRNHYGSKFGTPLWKPELLAEEGM